MSFKKFAPVLFLLSILFLPALAQRDSISLNTLVSKTEKLATDHPFEKIYLHFDKPYYAVGDTIWFKSYLVVGAKHQLSALSNIVYVDLLTSKDSLIRTLKIYSSNGTGYGDIAVTSPAFTQGNYHMRAYTNWMRNFATDYFFTKTISIGDVNNNPLTSNIVLTKGHRDKDEFINARILFKDRGGNAYAEKRVNWTVQSDGEATAKGKGNTDKDGFLKISVASEKLSAAATIVTVIATGGKKTLTNTFPLKTMISTADVQFFPEGGELIAGVRSKIAFKAINADGFGINVSGKIIDNTGAEVASFSSQHLGMGIFPLQPDNEKKYKAVITFADGSTKDFELPKIRSGGINVSVNNNDPDNLNIKIATNDAYFKAYQNRGFYIVAQSGGTIYYAGLAALQSLVYTAVVPKSKFPTGILQLTLFSADGEPQSERIVFIDHHDQLTLNVKPDKAEYTTRQHVTMSVSAKNAAAPVEGTFSVAVIDEAKVPFNEDAEQSILNTFLLTSDLKGYIEKPNYYFCTANSNATADLDVLMLTQGYRRFSYTDLLKDKYPPLKFLPEQGMNVTGTLRTSTGIPVNHGIVNMTLSDRNVSLNAETDPSGQFRFNNVSIYDSTKMVLSARNNAFSSDMMIIVDPPAAAPIVKNYNNPEEVTNIDSAMNAYLQNSKRKNDNAHVLNEVVIKASKPVQEFHKTYTSLTGLSMDPEQTVTSKLLSQCSDDFEGCVLTKVFGLWHVDDKYYNKSAYNKGDKRPVKFFVNGLAIDDGYLSNINPADVESINVYWKDGVSGLFKFYQCGGIISITTKNGDLDPFKKPKSNTNLSAVLSQPTSVNLTPKGFYHPRTFYSPKYAVPQSASERVLDLRTTIYWNPNIITDKNGNAIIDFYNSDGRGSYRALIEGIDADGNLGRYIVHYTVR